MILSTTPTIEGHPIREYRGVVTGETIIGTNFVKDFFASVRDVIGGRSGSYESTLREAKDTALRERWPTVPHPWAATPSWASTWITKPWATAAPC